MRRSFDNRSPVGRGNNDVIHIFNEVRYSLDPQVQFDPQSFSLQNRVITHHGELLKCIDDCRNGHTYRFIYTPGADQRFPRSVCESLLVMGVVDSRKSTYGRKIYPSELCSEVIAQLGADYTSSASNVLHIFVEKEGMLLAGKARHMIIQVPKLLADILEQQFETSDYGDRISLRNLRDLVLHYGMPAGILLLSAAGLQPQQILNFFSQERHNDEFIKQLRNTWRQVVLPSESRLGDTNALVELDAAVHFGSGPLRRLRLDSEGFQKAQDIVFSRHEWNKGSQFSDVASDTASVSLSLRSHL